MPKKLSPPQQRFISEFGNLYASYGFKRLNGLIIGLLLVSSEPLSLGEIARSLNRSKGLLSEATRRLQSVGFIKKIDGPEARKDYYTADEETFVNVFHFNMSTVQKNIAIAEKFLYEAGNGKKEEHARWKRNLRYMDAFYSQMSEFYEGFDKAWKNKIRSLKA